LNERLHLFSLGLLPCLYSFGCFEVSEVDLAIAINFGSRRFFTTSGFVGRKLEHVFLRARVKVDSVLFSQRSYWAVAHSCWRSYGCYLTSRHRLLISFCLAAFLGGDVFLEVFLVAVKVFCAGERILEQDYHRKEHF
jgi:hypothetical protein